jgi:Fe-S-cluster containining protein
MPDLKFGCTLCGRCCQNHSLPLTLDEAIAWLEDRGQVSIYCEAYIETGQPDARAEHRRKRSFPVRCGSSQARVTAIFVAVSSGECKNLGEDLKCRIYERRPLVCRIYPAEINPFIEINPASKACPAEAWTSGASLVDAQMKRLIEESRQTDRNDVPQKMLVCRELKINVAALADEGYAAYHPGEKLLLDILKRARAADLSPRQPLDQWRLYSPSLVTGKHLQARGLETIAEKHFDDRYSFLHGHSPPA